MTRRSINTMLTPEEIDNKIKEYRNKGVKLVSKECKHATYTINRNFEKDQDALIVKEWLVFDNGDRLPTVSTKIDYQRPYWITKKPYRDHKEKIHFEELKRVDKFQCRQKDLQRNLYNHLGKGRPTDSIRMLARQPYVYGCDYGAEDYYKQSVMDRWKDSFQPNTITVIDSETDMTKPGIFDPIMWSEVNDYEVIFYYNEEWAKGVPNYATKVREQYQQTLKEYMDQIRDFLKDKKGNYPDWIDTLEQLPLRIVPGKDSLDITDKMVDNLHRTQPDIVTGWNVFFDVSAIHGVYDRNNIDPADRLSDPRIDKNLRNAFIRKGNAEFVNARGQTFKRSPFECWDEMVHTASFRFADSMQIYYLLRKAGGKESGGYSLDAVLNRQIGVGKVKLASDDIKVPSNTALWHTLMQRDKKVEYGVYNIFDSLALRAQEYKNNDLTTQLSMLAGAANYEKFSSQPYINSVDMHFSAMRDNQKVICTTSDEMENEDDKEIILDRGGWIVTFQPHMVAPMGLYLFKDLPTVQSTVYKFGADADVETTYPTAEIIMNVGKEQTNAEPGKLIGVSGEEQRRQSINVTAGKVNAIEIMQSINKLRPLDDWADMIQNKYYSCVKEAA